MAITAEERSQIIALTVGMFGAAPGAAVLSELATAVDDGASIATLAEWLASSAEFRGIYPNFLTNEEFATNFIDNLVGDTVAAADKEWAVDYITAELNSGRTRASIIVEALGELAITEEDNELWGAAAAQFNNQVEVATYYSVTAQQSGDSLEALQNVIADVTNDDATVDAAIVEIEVGSTVGQTYTLTFSQDVISGGSGDDTINTLIDEDLNDPPYSTLTLGDVIDGGAGTDTLVITSNGDGDEIYLAGATITNVENLRVTDADEDFDSLDLAGTSFSHVEIINPTGGTTVDNAKVGTAFEFTNTGGAQTVNYSGATGTSDAMNLEVSGTATGEEVSFTVAAIETVNLTVSAASKLNGSTFDNAKALNITANAAITGDAADVIALANDAVIAVAGSANVQLGTLDDNGAEQGVTVNASELTGKLTVVGGANSVSITSGSGADTITSGAVTTTIAAGAGDDTVNIGAFNYGSGDDDNGSVSGGEGTDTLGITVGANVTDDLFDQVSGFEVLSTVGGAGVYDINGFGFASIVIGGNTAALEVAGIEEESVSITSSTTFPLTLALETATGAADALTVNVGGTAAVDVSDLVTANIETLTLNSTGKANEVTLTNSTASKVVVTGSSAISIDGLNAATTIIDASASAGLTMDTAVTATSAVSIFGSEKADTLLVAGQGSTINANAGGDVVDLGAAGEVDTLIVNAGDSAIGYTDTDESETYTAADDAESFDIVTGFESGVDVIDLGSFGFTGTKASALASPALTAAQAAALVEGTTASVADFFVDTGVQRGVAIVSVADGADVGGVGASTMVFIDTDADGDLTSADDMILLSGTATVTLADFGF